MSEAPESKAERLERMNAAFALGVPHNRALGLRFRDFERGVAWFELPFDERLVGNPNTGVIHGGAITAMLDAACGAAVFLALGSFSPIATLDLRIDYLKTGAPRRAVLCRTECYKLTRHIAFARGVAYQDAEDDPVACATGTFAIQRKGKPIVGAEETLT